LYVKARFSGYRRSQTNIHPNESLINIDGVSERKEANFYLGKTVIYALPKKNGVAKMIKGKINRLHGNSGLVGARFERNLPSKPHGMR
ncbi:MAG: 60S ribosomal protein L35A, partial [Paramarteilia canceri]